MSLLDFARCATAAHVERLVRAWRRVDRIDAAEDERRRHASRHLDAWVDEDGMLVVRGRLSPEAGAVVQRALEAAADRLYHESEDKSEVSAGQRRADALGLLAESALAGDLDRGTAGDRYQVVLHVDETVLGDDAEDGQSALEDGVHVPAETARRMACDASRVVMRHGRDGTVLDVGRKTRTIPPAIRRALVARGRTCRFPGCGCRHCDAHHVRHWAAGGATRLDNLLLLCRRHHRAVHEEGFTVELRDDGDARFFRPDGQPFPEAPPAPRWAGAALEPTASHLAAAGVTIDGDTATPDWYGESLDLPWAIQVLRPPGSGAPAGSGGRVAPGGYPPGAPTDPDVPNSGIRLLGLRIRCATVDAVHDARWGKRIVAEETSKRLPGQVGCPRAPTQPGPPPTFDLPVEVG